MNWLKHFIFRLLSVVTVMAVTVQGDFVKNIIRRKGVKVESWKVRSWKCHKFSVKEGKDELLPPGTVELVLGRTFHDEWLYGPATTLESKRIIYPCIKYRCSVPCPCLLCRKHSRKCKVPANQSCSCQDCLFHFRSHVLQRM